MSGPALVDHYNRAVNIPQFSKTPPRIGGFRREQQDSVHTAAGEASEKFNFILDQLIPLNDKGIVIIFM